MNITFILPYAGLAGGIRVVAIYAELLQQRGHKVVVVSIPKRPVPLKQKIKSIIKGKGWISSEPGPSHFDNLAVEHKVLEQYRPISNEDVPDADVVIATWWETAEWVSRLHSSKGRKYYFVQGHEAGLGSHLPVERVKATYSLPLRKITISKWLIDIMANEYGDRNVALVPNSVDFTFFNFQKRGRQPVPTVGFLYSPSHFKGCDVIIEALTKVSRVVPELRIISFGAKKPDMSLPLCAGTEYYRSPAQQEIVNIYSSCDFWIFGSRAEGFGLPILEAMACRTPVIATTAGAAPDLLLQGGGKLVGELDALILSENIIELMDLANSRWQLLSQQARDIATRYSWEDACDLFEKAIGLESVRLCLHSGISQLNE